MRYFLIFILYLLFTGCSAVEYKKADLSMYGGREGYLDQEIKPGVHILEVAQIGGYQIHTDYDGSMATLKSHWQRRAKELCPNGYKGKHQIIDPINAKIKDFYCPQRFCFDYPMVSGVIQCNK